MMLKGFYLINEATQPYFWFKISGYVFLFVAVIFLTIGIFLSVKKKNELNTIDLTKQTVNLQKKLAANSKFIRLIPVADMDKDSNEVTIVEKQDTKQEDGQVEKVILTGKEKLSLNDAYLQLNNKQKKYFNQIKIAMEELSGARLVESTYKLSVIQGREKVGSLFISGKIVRLDCILKDSQLKEYSKENDVPLKGQAVKFLVEDNDTLKFALFTIRLANNKCALQRKKKSSKDEVVSELPKDIHIVSNNSKGDIRA